MNSLTILAGNLTSPPILAFAAGAVSIWIRSDLKIPDQIYQTLTIYLLLAIGFKGGAAIADTQLSALAAPLLATLLIGALIPVCVFFGIKWFLRLDVANSAAMAAHYGSVSAVTFMACSAFLDRQGTPYESFLPAIMAVMEIPAIFAAMLLAKRFGAGPKVGLGESMAEVLSGKSFVLLICGLLAGGLAGVESRELMKPFLISPFYGVLMIFLLEMGQVAASRLSALKEVGKSLVVFALVAPVLQGCCGMLLAWSIGMSQGGAVVFAILSASASYIAAPAAVRAALPEANPGLYVTASLGITFPFNLIAGIPLLYMLSGVLY
ncbi:sodium-dependent bicarbonate transport family permease [Pelagicoccus albus]|uniref:Sodium-dependent bicarbonate transport family permease n=1 Tax=Pelagicoccus albus TaxID=415222 RepID=A0A7X1B7U3_9BACT|nr:sodium-dependent bicarbonate transport family permease [Pelagicoccus albus]MBC2607256.1 sodium-dependent bicarbonate transport family permease [Pelagicoccus albus]